MSEVEVRVPDLGDTKAATVVEVELVVELLVVLLVELEDVLVVALELVVGTVLVVVGTGSVWPPQGCPVGKVPGPAPQDSIR